jgi:hypothetical protein
MPYSSSFERYALEHGLVCGLERARQEGWGERRLIGWVIGWMIGWQEGQSDLVAAMLTRRFGTLPQPLRARLANATLTELHAWGLALLDAPTLDSVFVKP